ncbi:MAG TPA: L-threonylcarbamoyladenylate synthase [Gemmatimonadales bacterium]|nr:L-threonylcarbamoyladenylate synthase [Gemmatimonadales bacterium]
MILPFQSDAAIEAAIPQIGQHLRAGRLLAYPTETVYGLGSAPIVPALAALARLKGRPQGKPFLLLISSRRMAEEWGLVFNASASALAEAFWPGPLTLVLRGGEGRLPDELRGREGGIAVRYTSHSGVSRLVAATGRPLTSTSANKPGGPPAPGPDRLVELFRPEEQSGELLVLDGGVLGNVPPSTLVDCTDLMPRMVREGAIPRAELRRAAGRLAP